MTEIPHKTSEKISELYIIQHLRNKRQLNITTIGTQQYFRPGVTTTKQIHHQHKTIPNSNCKQAYSQ